MPGLSKAAVMPDTPATATPAKRPRGGHGEPTSEPSEGSYYGGDSEGSGDSEAFTLWSLSMPRRSRKKQGLVLKSHAKDSVAPHGRRGQVPARLRAGIKAAKARAQTRAMHFEERDVGTGTCCQTAKLPCLAGPHKGLDAGDHPVEAAPGIPDGMPPDLGEVVLEMRPEVAAQSPLSPGLDDVSKMVLAPEEGKAFQDVADFCRRSRRWLALSVCVVLAVLVIILMCMMLGLGPWHCHGWSGRMPKECMPAVEIPPCWNGTHGSNDTWCSNATFVEESVLPAEPLAPGASTSAAPQETPGAATTAVPEVPY